MSSYIYNVVPISAVQHSIYMYDWITMLYSRNWYNIVNQL